MNEEFDPKIKALAQAIKKQESGGHKDPYNAVGDNGTSRGAYQFQDATWKAWAKKHLKDENAKLTVENQNKVAYYQIKEFKEKGYNPAQIAAAWNAGEGRLKNDQWKTWKGTTTINGKEIAYDTPKYVENVSKYFREYAGTQQSSVSQVETPQSKEPGLLGSIGNAITDPFLSLGGGVANVLRTATGREQSGEKIPSLFGGAGVNPVGYRDGKELGVSDATQQLAGNVAMAGSNFLGAGAVKSIGTGIMAKTLPLATQLVKEGAVIGGSQFGGKALEEGKSGTDVAIETTKGLGLGAVSAPLIGVPLGLLPLITSAGRGAVTKELESKYISQATSDWERVGTDYVKSGGVLVKESKFGKDSTKFLGELGISPKDFVSDGKFNTLQLADELSGPAIKQFDDTLTEMLKDVQFGKKTIDITKLENAAIKKADSTSRITEGQRETMISNLKGEFAALRNKYPNGLVLPELNIQKGNYWTNTRFDATKPFQSDVNYIIGSTMKDAIEKSAPDAPVKELNSLLGDYHSAAKFLRSINNRVPKLTSGQKLASTFTKAAGTAIGGTVGGFPGAISGFLFGKTLSGVLDNATDPLKGAILRNLEKKNPQEYMRAIQYLGEKTAERIKGFTYLNNNLHKKATTEITNAIKPKVNDTFKSLENTVKNPYQPLK